MARLNFKALGAATAEANEAEETKAKKAKAAPPPEPEDTEEEENEDDEEGEEAPVPRASKRVAKVTKKAGKRKPAPAVEDDDNEAEEEEAAPTPTAKETFTIATSAPDHIMQFFKPAAELKGEAKINAMAFGELADHLATSLPRNPERAQCLRLLLQAGDCARRAVEGGEA